jgi:phosphatidylserine decarboxylase
MAAITVVFGGLTVVSLVLAVRGYAWFWPFVVLFVILWLGGLAFFRDPERLTPSESAIMVSPADGKITETALLDSHPDLGGPATRISIFLSVFDVHINRSPCAGTVRSVVYKPGKFVDARNPESGSLNESNTIVIDPDPPHTGPVVVRQVAGLIARRIVCSVKPGDRVETGQRIGLIKFGSRTDLVLPGHDLYKPTVTVGERAHGALTIVARLMTRSESANAARISEPAAQPGAPSVSAAAAGR